MTYPTTEIQHALGRIIGREHHRWPAIEKVSPQVVIRGVTAREGVMYLGDENDSNQRNSPIKDVTVIGNWIRGLPWWIVVVFATTLVYKLVLFPTWFCNGMGRTSAHESEKD
jgi:hypothetical protein